LEFNSLKYRRQFLLSPEKVETPKGWNVTELPEMYTMYTHPDIKISKQSKANYTVLLAGFIKNPYIPDETEDEIISRLVFDKLGKDQLFKKIENLTGRYICIAYLNGEYFIFSDPIGARSIYYCKDKNNHLWFSSQTSYLAEHFRYIKDDYTEKDLLSSKLFNTQSEYWYPGIISPFKEILHLIPNHYLDLKINQQIRYWPVEYLTEIPLVNAIDKSSYLLDSIFKSLSKRNDLVIGLTAGLDSRILLAGSKSVCNSCTYITHTHRNLSIKDSDIRIPQAIVNAFGINHKIVIHSDIIDCDLEKIIKNNVTNARQEKIVNAITLYSFFEKKQQKCILINGNAGEITRSYYYVPKVIKLDNKILSKLTDMENSKIAYKEFEGWQSGAKNAVKYGVDLLDLFYWEQRIGSWASMTYNEYDIAIENYSPFSSRELLTTLLKVNKKYRNRDTYIVHKEIIKNLWPDLLSIDINPPKNNAEKIKNKLKKTILFKIYKAGRLLQASKAVK
jgi:hypothetical protein